MADSFAGLFGKAPDEVLHKLWNVIPLLAQRRNCDRKHVQSEKQVTGRFLLPRQLADHDWLPRSAGHQLICQIANVTSHEEQNAQSVTYCELGFSLAGHVQMVGKVRRIRYRYHRTRARGKIRRIEDAKVHSSRYRSSDLNLAAGCERIVFRPLQDRVEPSTSDADIASGKERERERILQQTPQRESVI